MTGTGTVQVHLQVQHLMSVPPGGRVGLSAYLMSAPCEVLQ
jgi:predicted thioesterase